MINNNANNERIVYADLMRIVAAFAVVVLHTAAGEWSYTSVNDLNWHISNIFDSMVRWCVPVFVMLSGMFFLNPEKEITTAKIFKKYILRIVIALIFWGLFYNLTLYIFLDSNTKVDYTGRFWFVSYAPYYLRMFIYGLEQTVFDQGWYHLWYLYMIIGLYILTPLYRVFVKYATHKDLIYLLCIFAFFGLCITMYNSTITIINPNLKTNFVFTILVNYSGYYFAGYYFSKYEISKNVKKIIYISGGLSLIFTIVGTSYLSYKTGNPTQVLYGNLLPTTMFEAYTVFIFIKSLSSKIQSPKIKKIISSISATTFGIYLLHPFILKCFYEIGINTHFITPFLTIPIVSISAFIISFCVIFLIRKIKISKYIM